MFEVYGSLGKVLKELAILYDSKPSKIVIELDESKEFYNVFVYKKVIYDNEIRDAIITLKVDLSTNDEVIFKREDKAVYEITITDDSEE